MAEETKLQDEVLLQENRNLQILQRSLSGALKEVFGEYTESQRFLDLKRVPLICKDVQNIVKNQEDEKKEREKRAQDTDKILEDHRKELNKNIEDIKGMIEKKEDDHENRLRALETFMNTLIGKMAIIGVASSIIVSLIFVGVQYFLGKH